MEHAAMWHMVRKMGYLCSIVAEEVLVQQQNADVG